MAGKSLIEVSPIINLIDDSLKAFTQYCILLYRIVLCKCLYKCGGNVMGDVYRSQNLDKDKERSASRKYLASILLYKALANLIFFVLLLRIKHFHKEFVMLSSFEVTINVSLQGDMAKLKPKS
uniref:Uncharacterized protein n=1 Tax=Glossina brevipalpis TaxID=37001 RepID=A0A1A9W271_9MUSC